MCSALTGYSSAAYVNVSCSCVCLLMLFAFACLLLSSSVTLLSERPQIGRVREIVWAFELVSLWRTQAVCAGKEKKK